MHSTAAKLTIWFAQILSLSLWDGWLIGRQWILRFEPWRRFRALTSRSLAMDRCWKWKTLAREVGVAERVRFLGPQTQPQYAVRLRESVGLVLPSLHESGGAVVLEAMATAKPVIATRWGGPLDYLDSSCGILVAPQSYEALVTGFAQAMQKLIDQPDLAKAMGAAGRERAVRDFDWQRRIDAMVGIYDILIKKPILVGS